MAFHLGIHVNPLDFQGRPEDLFLPSDFSSPLPDPEPKGHPIRA